MELNEELDEIETQSEIQEFSDKINENLDVLHKKLSEKCLYHPQHPYGTYCILSEMLSFLVSLR